MSDNERFRRKLDALAKQTLLFDGGKRVLTYGKEPTAAVSILQVIDGTVIKRELTFSRGAHQLVLDVANRRVFAVGQRTSAELRHGPLSATLENDDETISALVGAIKSFDDLEEALLLSVGVTGIAPEVGQAGISVPVLSEAIGFDINPPRINRLLSFIDHTDGLFEACVVFGPDGVVTEFGEANDIALLSEVQANQWQRHLGTDAQSGRDPFLVFVDKQPESDVAFAAINYLEFTAFLKCPSSAEGKLSKVWQSHFLF